MKRLLNSGLAALLVSVAVGAVAVAQEPQTATEIDPAAEPPRCVRLRMVNGYSVIDSRHLILNGGASRHYLVTMGESCPSLTFGAQLGTTFGRNERVCRPFLEYVIDRDGWRCAIRQVEEVDSPDAARSLIAARAELAEAEETNASD